MPDECVSTKHRVAVNHVRFHLVTQFNKKINNNFLLYNNDNNNSNNNININKSLLTEYLYSIIIVTLHLLLSNKLQNPPKLNPTNE